MGEIVAQDALYERFAAYFMRLLRIGASSHPHTCTLLHVAGVVGVMASIHFKAHPGGERKPRVRPNQLRPALMPPVDVPGHPSFPSGHATQSMLMALLVERAMPATMNIAWRPLLQTLSGRIARNREIAGLHYPSDSRAGVELAVKVAALLDPEKCPVFKSVLEAAQKEWVS
jgi:membrane-associated phospholipid phosphatase